MIVALKMFNLEKITENLTTIPITKTSFEKMKDYAKLAKGTELYGFLLSPIDYNDGIVRKIVLAKNQIVSSGSAKLDPIAAAESKAEIEELGFKPIGFWHSHGGFSTFHSHIDDENMRNHYLTLALNNEEKIEIPTKNNRYLDSENGRMVYIVDGLEISISLLKPDKAFEKRFLSSEYIQNPSDSKLIAALTGDLRMFLKYDDIYFDIENIKDVQIKRYPAAQFKTMGLAYSIVVNDRGKSYGEIAMTSWCNSCERQENFVHKNVGIRVVEEGNEKYNIEELKKEIDERVKTHSGNKLQIESGFEEVNVDEEENKSGEKLPWYSLQGMIGKKE